MRMDGRRFNGAAARALRRVAGIKMIDMARAIGASYGHLRMAETTDRAISDEMAHRIRHELSRHLGREVSIDEISSVTERAQDAVA